MNDMNIDAEVEQTFKLAKYWVAFCAIMAVLLLSGTAFVVWKALAYFGVLMAGVPL